jgi:NADH-quinone oxidoreductase subunit G
MGLALIQGKPLDDAFSSIVNEGTDTLIILENDLYRRADEESIDQLFKKSKQIIVLDHSVNKTTMNADLVFPVSTFAESEGTFVNNEGRAQRFYECLPAKDQVKASWEWVAEFIKIQTNNRQSLWIRFDDIVSSIAKELPAFSGLKEYEPDADFRMLNMKIPRQTKRYSGRTAINSHQSVSEPKIPQDPDSPLTFSMEGQSERPASSLVPFYWVPGWNSVQAINLYLDEPNGSLIGGDPGIRLIEPAELPANCKFYKI